MAKAIFGNLSSQFQDFDTVAQLASQTRSLRYQDYHHGRLAQLIPQHELLSSDQTSFSDLNQTATNLGALDQYIKSGSKRDYCQELPDWIRDYLIKQPLGLNQPPRLAPVLNQGQIIKLQYYLDPAVENIIQSGQAGSVLSLFLSDELADHPQLATFGSGVVKLLKVIILDSIHPEDDPTQSMINNCRTIADLTRVTDQLAGYFLDRNDFGHVINHDLTSLYYKRSRGYSPRSDLELATCRLFELWHGLDPTQLETLLGDCRNGSLGPKAALPQSTTWRG